MPVRTARSSWSGTLQSGSGRMTVGSGVVDASFSAGTRFGDDPGTNPEELIGAAFAGCFSMALAYALGQAGYQPDRIETTARVHIERVEGGFRIETIELDTEAHVPGIDEQTFHQFAEQAKNGCPVSQALRGVGNVILTARLAG